MPVDMEKLLGDALASVKQSNERDELEERFKRLEARKPGFTMSDVIGALENASDDELEALRGTLLAGAAAQVEAERDDASPDDKPKKQKPPPRRTRPGRKSGSAYDWWVDDNGEVVKLDVARVYTGEDESDEVELRAAEVLADNAE